MSMGLPLDAVGMPRNRETGNVAVEGFSWDQGNISTSNSPMRAQANASASGGYGTVLGSCSAVTLVRATVGNATESKQTFSKWGMILCLTGFCLFVHATRLEREFFPPQSPGPSLSHCHHWLQYPVLSSLICENSQIEPLREGLTKDGDDDVCCG
jgi:hypothetical protein